MRLVPLLLVAGCFSPTVEEGAECSAERECPPGQTCAADGRCYGEAPTFHFRRRIDMHPLSLSNVQRDFALSLVMTGDEGLAAHARDDGLDLHFTEGDGTTELAFEVESFDPEAGDLVAWVRMPLLSFEDTIYLHYGGEPFDRPAPAAAWHERYLAVWHGGDGDPAELADSTGNRNDGASVDQQVPKRVAGVVGPALSFDGIDDQVLIEESVPLVVLDPEANLLLTMWVRVPEESGLDLAAVMGKGSQSGSDPGFGVQISDLAWLVRLRGGGTSDTEAAVFGDPALLTGRWVMLGIAITHGGAGEEYFEVSASVDGEEVGSGYWLCQTGPCALDLGGSLLLSHPEARFQGMIDEIRIIDRTLGSENQRVGFENLTDPGTFYTVGAEETLGL
jgi:hypothetical protein